MNTAARTPTPYTPSSMEADVREWRGITVVGYESVSHGLYKNGTTCQSVGGVARALVRVQDVAKRNDALVAALEEARDIVATFLPHNKYEDGSIIPGPSKVLQRIDAALAAARGEQS
jgi:hypothetical protein